METAGKKDGFSANEEKLEKLAMLLKCGGISLFEYDRAKDELTIYGRNLETKRKEAAFLENLREKSEIVKKDCWKAAELLSGRLHGSIELHVREQDGSRECKRVDAVPVHDDARGEVLLGYIQDITMTTERERRLEELSRRDSLTGLYNHASGKVLADQYLNEKNPYTSCGLMVIDIDYFKNVNDNYGHLFGDEVLKEFAGLLRMIFDRKDILIRAGGDEFVVFLKNIGHSMLTQKATQLTESARRLTFTEKDYCMTCSVGVCFLPQNMMGYSYGQLFENADWALYQAKEKGRNQYVFCDSLRRFGHDWKKTEETEEDYEEIDARYLRNDVVATAFEVFEKSDNFDSAIELLLKVIGIRYRLDRITVIRTDIREQNTTRQYQWTSPETPEALAEKSSFTREDFLTLFMSYDEYGTTVLHEDNLNMYSEGARKLLMQGNARTVVYAAMYVDAKYTGAISYVTCKNKRFWSKQSRRELGEITKIITAYLSRHLTVNDSGTSRILPLDTDSLTGLLSFSRFREEVEQKIVAGYAASHGILYVDFVNFREFNQNFGFTSGDQLLKDFSHFMIEGFLAEGEAYFTRIISDQFAVYFPYRDSDAAVRRIQELAAEFIRTQRAKHPGATILLRSGIYFIGPGCLQASAAIDAANAARKQTDVEAGKYLVVYEGKIPEGKPV